MAPAAAYVVGAGPLAVAAADFTGDGRRDLAVTDTLSDDISLLPGTGGGHFGSRLVVPISDPSAIVAGDFTRDGFSDLAVAHGSTNTVTILRGQPGGFFVTLGSYVVNGGTCSKGLAVGDLNGDGRLDLVAGTCTNAAGTVSVLLANGNGTFAPAVTYTTGGSDRVAIGDINRDGRPDIVAAGPLQVGILYGNLSGNGTFPSYQAVRYSSSGGNLSVALADIDGDGTLDISVADSVLNNITVIHNYLAQRFGVVATVNGVGPDPESLVAADFNNDGKLDLATVNGTGSVSVYQQTPGTTPFTTAPFTYSVPGVPWTMIASDLDGNGSPDLAIANQSGFANVLMNTVVFDATAPTVTVPGPITAEASSSLGAAVSFVVSASDVDDAAGPVLCTRPSGSTFPLGTTTVSCISTDTHNNTSVPVGFTVTVRDTTPPALSAVANVTAEAAAGASSAVVTYASPTAADLVSGPVPVNCSPPSGSSFLLGAVVVTCSATDTYGNIGHTTFVVRVWPHGPTLNSLPSDMVVAATTPDGAVVSYTLPKASDPFDPAPVVSCAPASGTLFPLGLSHVFCWAIDSDGDVSPTSVFSVTVVDSGPTLTGVPADITVDYAASGTYVNYVPPTASDIVDGPLPVVCAPVSGSAFPVGTTTVTCRAVDSRGLVGTATFTVTVRPPTVSFAAAVNYSGGPAPDGPGRGVAVGDVNGDGKPDLVDLNNSGAITVFQGASNGTFNIAGTYAAGTPSGSTPTPRSLGLGDFNGDGKLDVAVASYAQGGVIILLNLGNGSFGNAVMYPSGGTPTALVVADVNGDGHADVVVTDLQGPVAVLRGLGGGSFATPQLIPLISPSDGNPIALAVGDLNGDGRPDIAGVSLLGVSVSLNVGGVTFAPGSFVPVAGSPVSVAIGDLNSDGKADLVLALSTALVVGVLPGNGQGNFGGPIPYPAGLGPSGVAIADVTGDGKPDVVVGNRSSNSVSILVGGGGGTLASPVTLGVNIAPTTLALADLNGDGALDVVAASQDSDQLAVLLHDAGGPPPPPVDTTAPTLVLPDPIVVDGTSPAGADVTYTITATDPDDAVVNIDCSIFSTSKAPHTFPVGTTTVTCTATDTHSNTSPPGSFTVTVRPSGLDTTAPTLNLPDSIVVDATSAAGTIVTYTVTATDPDDAVAHVDCSILSTSSAPHTFPVGMTNVTCTATDTNGNTSAPGTFTVTVVPPDTTPPTVTVPDAITAEAASSAGAAVSFSVGASDDAGPTGPVTCSADSGSTFAIGLTTVTCHATDSNGNTGTASFTVTVQDTTPPAFAPPKNQTAEATGPTGAVGEWPTPTATDAVDGTDAVDCGSPGAASGATFALGVTTITCSATDAAGNTATHSFTLTIQDTTPPVLSVPSDIITEQSVVSYDASALDSVDGSVTPVCSPASGSTFAVGATLVTCTATDAHGNGSSASFTVTEFAPPHLSTSPNQIVEATGPDGASATFTATASGGSGPLVVACVDQNGLALDSPKTFPLGVATATCTATDGLGGTTTATFTVTVQDTTPPVISNTPSDIIAEATSSTGSSVSYALPSATDLVDGPTTVECAPAPGSSFALGTTTVTCSSKDAHGNVSTDTGFNVTVRDTTAPTLGAPPADITVEANVPGGATVGYSKPTATDTVDQSPTVDCTPPPGSTLAVGTTIVSCTAKDASGNTSAAKTFTITVLPSTPPTLALPADFAANATSPGGATVSFTVHATDFGGRSILVTCTPASGSTFAIGTTSVNCSATDALGHRTGGSFKVSVVGPSGQLATLATSLVSVGGGSFSSQLNDVRTKFNAGMTAAACNSLTAVENHARAQSGKQLTTSQANAVLTAATRIRHAMGC